MILEIHWGIRWVAAKLTPKLPRKKKVVPWWKMKLQKIQSFSTRYSQTSNNGVMIMNWKVNCNQVNGNYQSHFGTKKLVRLNRIRRLFWSFFGIKWIAHTEFILKVELSNLFGGVEMVLYKCGAKTFDLIEFRQMIYMKHYNTSLTIRKDVTLDDYLNPRALLARFGFFLPKCSESLWLKWYFYHEIPNIACESLLDYFSRYLSYSQY